MTDDKTPVNNFRAKQKRKKTILTVTISALSVIGLAVAGSLITVTVLNNTASSDFTAQVGLDQNVKNVNLWWDYEGGAGKDLISTPTGDWTIDADLNPGFTSVDHPGCSTKWISPASPADSDEATDASSTQEFQDGLKVPGVTNSSTFVNVSGFDGSVEFATSHWVDEESGASIIAYYRDMPQIEKIMLVQLTCDTEEKLVELTGGLDNLNPISDYGVTLNGEKN